MKKILKIVSPLIIILITIIGCDNDDVDTDVPSQRLIFTSEQNQDNQIRLGTSLTFADVSTGVISRKWTFPDDVTTIKESNEDIVKTIFSKVGEHNVVLNQTFEESAFVNGEQRGKELDTTIVVRVLEPIKINLKANYINPDGSLGAALTIADNTQNEVIASRSIRYSFETIGEPEDINWTLDGGDPESSTGASEIDVTYKRVGTYDLKVEASTRRPFGEDQINFSNLIKVVPSTDPVSLDEIKGKRDGRLALEFSREMDETTINKANFSLTIQNGTTTIPAVIRSVTINPTQRNILDITLDGDSVYIDDVVTVSYVAVSLFTADGVQANSFTDIPMSSFEQGTNILETTTVDFSFENSTDDSNWPYQFWGGIWELYDFSIAFDKARTGNRSGIVDMQANGGMIIAHDSGSFPLETGTTYEIGIWTFVENLGNTPDGLANPDLRLYWIPATNFSVGPSPEFTSDFPLNQWVYKSIIVTATETEDKQFLIRGYNEFNDAPIRIFMDDLFVSEVTIRP